jgi:hypothetical protein
MTMRSATLRMLGLVALAGCAPPGVEEYAQELELAYCEWQTECHNFAGVDDCVASRTIDRDEDFAYMTRAVVEGSAEYDPESAVACLTAIRQQSCEDPSPAAPEPCEAVFRGRIGRNGPCMSSLECVGDAVCGFDPACVDQCCVGACRVLAEPLEKGVACGGSIACADGLYCAFDASTGLSTVCTPHVKVGGSCSFGEVCAEAAYCDGSTCRKTTEREIGELCGDPGDRCKAPAECRYASGEEGESPTCVVAGGLGAKCSPYDYESCARFDTFCDPISLVCTLLPVPGAACAAGCVGYAECRSLATADGFEGTCVALAGEGEGCGDGGDGAYVACLGDLVCDGDVCVLPEPEPASDCPVPET